MVISLFIVKNLNIYDKLERFATLLYITMLYDSNNFILATCLDGLPLAESFLNHIPSINN